MQSLTLKLREDGSKAKTRIIKLVFEGLKTKDLFAVLDFRKPGLNACFAVVQKAAVLEGLYLCRDG